MKASRPPVTLVLGLRRTGKSSPIQIALNELGLPYIYLDMREFEGSPYLRYRDFLSKFEIEVDRLTKKFPGLTETQKSERN
ncbi:hypothetical protein [Conexivisphaera calida]|uniref:hypothetical protein n=1 Tax=Conexivisphaera calida TaxID=1874277 RepID=UPI001E2DF850|nr:hypothetical protein [Conexivisphaera calida]